MHHHRSASKSHQGCAKSQHHHDSRKDIIITRLYVGDRHLRSSVSKSESHHHRSRSAFKICHDHPGSTSKSKAESDFDGSAILRGVLSDQSYQSSNHHTYLGGTIECAEYFPNNINVNIDAEPSNNMPQTPSTKGSIVDQIGSIGSHFSRLFLTTPNPAYLETRGTAPHAIASTTCNSGHHHLNPLPPAYYQQTDGTAPHAIASTTLNSGCHHLNPLPSAHSWQTAKTKTKSHNKDEQSVNANSVHATRGNRTKKGVRKEY